MDESGTEQSNLAPNTFVGRERELAELVSACEAGVDSDAHLFLIHGEPGIGKTRLADELASRAKARGLRVLWGRCWEGGGAPAYWPWIQVVRAYLGLLDPERRRFIFESEVAPDIVHQMAQIVPELRHAPSPHRPPQTDNLEPNEARFRLFDSVTNFLKIAARSNPMLIVLDDLHDADEASLVMLRFLTRELKGVPIMIVATYRDAEVHRSQSLSKLVGELSREGRNVPLGSLNQSEVLRFVELAGGTTPDAQLVAKLSAATNGNPLFLDGIVRILIAESSIASAGTAGRQFKIPIGVGEAIRRRLDGLSQASNSILSVAAAIGNEFEFNLCHSVSGIPVDEAHRLLDEAASAGIVTAFGQGHCRFCHALIREAVYEELDTSARVRIHASIAARIEEIYRADIDAHLAELAHHFREAIVTEKAIDYSIRAGYAAAKVLAFAEAMVHMQAALELMEQNRADVFSRAELLASLSQIAFQVDRAAALRYGDSALALYESLGQIDRAAYMRVHLGNIFHMREDPLFNEARASEHLRRAESVLGTGPENDQLAYLYCTIAANEAHNLNLVESARAAQRSMEIADRIGSTRWPHAAAFYAYSLAMRGKLAEGFALFERANDASVKEGGFCFPAAWGAGSSSGWLGDPRGARAWYERVLRKVSKDAAPLP